jgi:large subunit ribosomal protein L19
MSTAISCTRAAVPRVTFKAARCQRFASTETVSTESATAPILSTQRPRKVTESLGVKMHRTMYPEHYKRIDEKNWKPNSDVSASYARRPAPKKINAKWAPTMQEKGVQRSLSTHTQAPMEQLQTPPFNSRCLERFAKTNSLSQVNTSVSPSSHPQLPTSRKPAPIPSQP